MRRLTLDLRWLLQSAPWNQAGAGGGDLAVNQSPDGHPGAEHLPSASSCRLQRQVTTTICYTSVACQARG